MKWIIEYGTGKPGTTQESFEGTYYEARRYAADHARGWGYGIIRDLNKENGGGNEAQQTGKKAD